VAVGRLGLAYLSRVYGRPAPWIQLVSTASMESGWPNGREEADKS